MNRRFLVTFAVCAAVACGRENNVVRLVAGVDLNVGFGWSVERLKEARPRVSYAPYLGWHEVFDSGTVAEIVYDVGGTPEEAPLSNGQVRRITAIGRDSIPDGVRMLARLAGLPTSAARQTSCAPVPGQEASAGTLRSVWQKDSLYWTLSVTVILNGDSLWLRGPAVIDVSHSAARPSGEAMEQGVCSFSMDAAERLLD